MDKAKLFERFNHQDYKRLWGFILLRVRDGDMASDIMQDTLTAAWRNAEQLRDDDRLKGWMYSIAKNTIKQYLQKRNRHYAQNVELDEDVIDGRSDSLRNNESAEDVMLARMEVKDAQAYVDSLPPETKQIVTLYARGDYTFDQIGQLLGIPPETAKSRYYRAKRKYETLKDGRQ